MTKKKEFLVGLLAKVYIIQFLVVKRWKDQTLVRQDNCRIFREGYDC